MGNLQGNLNQAGARQPGVSFVLLPALVSALLSLASLSAAAGQPYRFDATGYLGEASLMPDWADTMNREAAQSAVLDACLAEPEACPRYYRGLRHVLLRAESLPQEKQITLISRYVNKKRYRDDRTAHLKSAQDEAPLKYRSRWSTVEEFMRRGGDCEDYATTKYYLLRRLGFSADQLRIVVTWERGERGFHAVLAVRLEDAEEPKILLLESDNTIKRGGRHRYRFIYSVNEESIWDHEANHASASGKQPASLNKETSA
jgi:predicted transglutaminase-like cysteine proteinase